MHKAIYHHASLVRVKVPVRCVALWEAVLQSDAVCVLVTVSILSLVRLLSQDG